jgi:LysM repeat protein
MSHRKNSSLLICMLTILAVTVSACIQPFPSSQVSLNTPTGLPTSFFVSPFPTSDNPMAMVEELSTGTALAATSVALTAGTPAATQADSTATTPDANVTLSATADGTVVASATPTLGSNTATPAATQASPTTIVNRPASYTLQKGEFPYCIARRYNLNPDELISLNGLQSGELFSPGLTLKIPQTGNPWPGTRYLHNHPDTYIVDNTSETLYGVACYYGDVDPAAISQANNLPLTATLTVGQQLTIP